MVDQPAGWKPGKCWACGNVAHCNKQRQYCPLSSALPVRPVNGWGEISHAGQLYTVQEANPAEDKRTEGK